MQSNKKNKTRQNPYYFDTLESTQELEDCGFTHKQAVVQIKIIEKALSGLSKSQLTKQDLDLLGERLRRLMDEKVHGIDEKIHGLNVKLLEVKNELDSKIAKVESHLASKIGQVENRLESKIKQVESHLIKILFGAITSSTTITIAALGFLMTYLK